MKRNRGDSEVALVVVGLIFVAIVYGLAGIWHIGFRAGVIAHHKGEQIVSELKLPDGEVKYFVTAATKQEPKP